MNLRTKPTELISTLRQYIESFWPLKDVHPSGEPVGIPQTVKDGRMLGDVPTRCMGVSENSGTPKSSISIGFSIINHPFWGTPFFGNTRMVLKKLVGLTILMTKAWSL